MDDEATSLAHWIDAAHTAILVYSEEGAAACDRFMPPGRPAPPLRPHLSRAILSEMPRQSPESARAGAFPPFDRRAAGAPADSDRLTALLKAMARAVSQEPDADAAVTTLLLALRKGVGADSAAIQLFDPAAGDLRRTWSTPAGSSAAGPGGDPLVVTLHRPGGPHGRLEVAGPRLLHPSADDRRLLETAGMVALLAAGTLDAQARQQAAVEERDRLYHQLVQSQKMSALGRLAASIAHEVNNPLQAMGVCLTLAAEELDDLGRTDKLRQYVELVSSEVARVTAIVQRMRDLSRPARAGTQPVDLPATLDSVLTLCDKHLQHNRVTVVRQWAGELPLLPANADHLRQVFVNLVLNAVESMPGGGTLTVRTELEPAQAAQRARIDLVDTGEGIRPADMGRVFEPFFTTKQQGLGLGLYISRGLIQAHGGEIALESRPGAGTRVSVLLPLGEA